MKVTCTIAAAVVLAATAVALTLAAPAGAGGGCPENKLCVFENEGRDGTVVKIGKKGLSNKIAEKLNNEASSVINNRAGVAFLYDKRNGKGDKRCLAPGVTVESLGDSATFDDLASSSKNTTRKGCPGD